MGGNQLELEARNPHEVNSISFPAGSDGRVSDRVRKILEKIVIPEGKNWRFGIKAVNMAGGGHYVSPIESLGEDQPKNAFEALETFLYRESDYLAVPIKQIIVSILKAP